MLLGCQVVHMRWLEDSVKKSILLNPSGYHIEEHSNKFQQRNQEVGRELRFHMMHICFITVHPLTKTQGKLSLFEDFEFIIKEGSKRRLHELVGSN